MSIHRLTYLDVLKAIAVIAVVLYHFGLLPYGYLGVDVFFVVGGFLVTRSLQRRSEGGRGWYPVFLFDRLLRLLPVLLVAGIAAMAAGWFTMLPDDYENLSESVVATDFFANNILSAITTGDYWNIANEYKPLMHTWYVGLLMQLYVLYPLLFLLSGLDRKSPQKTLLVLVASLTVLSLVCYIGCTNEAHRFYYVPSRFFEFGIGGVMALLYRPSQEGPFYPVFSYICYGALVALLAVGYRLVPDDVRLVLVVALACVVVLSGGVLENRVTANGVLARVGAASFSIYVWHQVVVAFWRYVFGNVFTVWQYVLLLCVVAVVSWGSYVLIEKRVAAVVHRRRLGVAVLVVWLTLTMFAGYVYWNGGVVRDVPELGISVRDRHRGMNVEYTEQGFQYDRPFDSSDKQHWLVIGNSFGRDFVNVVLESAVADEVEISYIDSRACSISDTRFRDRFASADRVFVATRGLSRRFVSAVEVECWAGGLSPDKVMVVGDKSFGENNGHVYAKRHRPDYFEQTVEPEGGEAFLGLNRRFRDFYGERFIDVMGLVTSDDGMVRVFTPEGHFLSPDGKHLTRAGARFFAGRIDWGWLLSKNECL